MKPILRTSALALLVLTGGCMRLYQEPQVHLAGVRVVGLGFTSGTAEIHLEVENPNRYAVEVSELRYLLEVSEGAGTGRWTHLASGSTEEPIRLDRRSQRDIYLNVPFQYRGVESALRAFLAAGEVPYRVQGDLRARGPTGEVALPFRSQGRLGR